MKDWDSIFSRGDNLINSLREEQLELLRRVGDKWKIQLEQWEDLANAEDSLKREYGGRYLFELLQNADDAMTDKSAKVGSGASQEELNRVAVVLTGTSILVANDGLPFSPENLRSLCRLYNSTKSASKQIGHKGIGFKSVLEITDNPEVYSSHFAFGFDRKEFAAEVRRITKAQELDAESLSILRVPFVRRLARLPHEEQQQIQALLDSEFATVIRLPLKRTITMDVIVQQIQTELRPELLLFLESTKQLLIQLPDGEKVEYWYETQRKQDLFQKRPFQNVKLWSNKNGQIQMESHWLLLASEKMPIVDLTIREGLGRAWEAVKAVKCAVAFRLTPDGKALDTNHPEQKFSVYFPTEEKSGLRFLINADLYIEAARKDIRLNTLNAWLAESMALYIATAGVDALRSQFPCDPDIVEVLAPVRKPGRDFGDFFYDRYLLALSQTEFVPIEKGKYCDPGSIRLTPKGVNLAYFRRFFSPEMFDNQASWNYPLLAVEEKERTRHDPFLLLKELGGSHIAVDELVSILRHGPSLTSGEEAEFVQFLVDWWYGLTEKDQKQLKHALEECAVIPTQHAWKAPKTENIFQANLRDDTEVDVPAGFGLALVPLHAYGDDRAYDGRTANFLSAMGVRRYQAAEILRRSIFPVMSQRDQFNRLLSENNEAVYAGYRILQDYRERERSGTQFEEIRTQVFVPCYRLFEPDKLLWKPAYQVYFAHYWTNNEDLEKLYGKFKDGYFLTAVPQIFQEENEAARELWFEFFIWLGVNKAPRLLSGKNSDLWNVRLEQHLLQEHSRWSDYVAQYHNLFDCSDANHVQPNPNRRFLENYALHHFEDIVSTRDRGDDLYHLLRLLGSHWQLYKPYLTIQLRCRYKNCDKPSAVIPSYFFYCLKQIPWLVAERWGVWEPLPYRAADIWNLEDDVRPEVRRMLPSLPDEFRQDAYHDLRSDLLRREVKFDDYLALLKRLPDICPVTPPEDVEIEAYQWHRAVRAVFNWLGQAMHNSLDRLGDTHWPPRPSDLQVLAYQDETPGYISVSHPLIVYPDDVFIAQEWQKELWFLKIDDNWTRLRDWLQIPFISQQVVIKPHTTADMGTETAQVCTQFKMTLPAFLAVVQQQQNSRYERVMSRLQRLDIHVVEQLILSQTYLPQPEFIKEINKEIYLQPRDDPNPRGGQTLRAGDLYISYDACNNPDILGQPIANYVEIAGLRDTFVLLYERPGREARERYLENRGITSVEVEKIRQDLNIEWDEDTLPPEIGGLSDAFQKRSNSTPGNPSISVIAKPKPDSDLSNDPSGDEVTNGNIAGVTDDKVEEWLPQLDDLDLGTNITFHDYLAGRELPLRSDQKPKTKPIVIGGGLGSGPRVSEKVKEVYGQRGEEWAFHAEKQRLLNLGFTRQEVNELVRWISKENKYAQCDIVSVDGKPGDNYEIYIEVKATTGTDHAVNWSIAEFDLATEAGDQYWFYWVGNVKSAQPTLTRYQNPVQLWRNKHAILDFRKLVITLPEPEHRAIGDMNASSTTPD